MISADQHASDLAWCNLRHVKNNDCALKSYTNTCNCAASNEELPSGRRDLEDTTHNEDPASGNDRGTTAKVIGKVTGDDGTKEGSGREDGCDERLDGRRKGKALDFGCRCPGTRNRKSSVKVDHIVHTHHTGNVPHVVPKKYPTECSESARHVSFGCDRSLDELDIVLDRVPGLDFAGRKVLVVRHCCENAQRG